jgi:THO complex subunit 6
MATIILDSLFYGSSFVACTNKGKIILWPNAAESIKYSWDAHSGPIYSLTTNKTTLISGGINCIKLWQWADIIDYCNSGLVPKPLKVLPTSQDRLHNEVNALVEHRGHLFSAMGNNQCYEWDLNSGSLVRTYNGHTQFLHDVALKFDAESSLFTASEDGSVRVWDLRTANARCIIDCEKGAVVTSFSPASKKVNWISSLEVKEDWLACGGFKGVHMWYLPAMQYTSYIPLPNVQTLLCHQNAILSGGNGTLQESNLYIWSQDGKPVSQIKTSIPSIYSLSKYQNGSDSLIAVCGASEKIELYSSSAFLPLHFSLSLSVEG